MMVECEAFDFFATAGDTDTDCAIMDHHTALPCTTTVVEFPALTTVLPQGNTVRHWDRRILFAACLNFGSMRKYILHTTLMHKMTIRNRINRKCVIDEAVDLFYGGYQSRFFSSSGPIRGKKSGNESDGFRFGPNQGRKNRGVTISERFPTMNRKNRGESFWDRDTPIFRR